MPSREGEVYRCPDTSCGCELTVTKQRHPPALAYRPRPAAERPW